MSGMLAMRGVERPVTIAARVLGHVTDPSGTPRLAYQGTAQINRKDWGLTWNQALEAGQFEVLMFDVPHGLYGYGTAWSVRARFDRRGRLTQHSVHAEVCCGP